MIMLKRFLNKEKSRRAVNETPISSPSVDLLNPLNPISPISPLNPMNWDSNDSCNATSTSYDSGSGSCDSGGGFSSD